MQDADGERTHGLQHGESFSINVEIEALEELDSPAVGVWLENEERVRLFGASTDGGGGIGPMAPGERVTLSVVALNTFRSGHYYAGVSVGRVSGGEQLDAVDRAADVIVYGGDTLGGLVQLPHRVDVSRAALERVTT